jgi:hypothetical protein
MSAVAAGPVPFRAPKVGEPVRRGADGDHGRRDEQLVHARLDRRVPRLRRRPQDEDGRRPEGRPAPFSPAAPVGVAGAGAAGATLNLALYVDSVNGTAPAGTQPRTVGCTQTNVCKRGERVVIRAWGTDLATGDVLTNVNVDTATFSIPGQPVTTMAWSAHGTVYYWTNFWIVPANFPLGTTTVHIVFTDGRERQDRNLRLHVEHHPLEQRAANPLSTKLISLTAAAGGSPAPASRG